MVLRAILSRCQNLVFLSRSLKDLNVLIGENDSGKTTIIDAIRYTLNTLSGEWIHFDESDFHSEGGNKAQDLKIECIFRGFSNQEASHFLEWIGTEEIDGKHSFVLKVRLTAAN